MIPPVKPGILGLSSLLAVLLSLGLYSNKHKPIVNPPYMLKGRDRNRPCSCFSGAKAKKCCTHLFNHGV